MLSGPLITEARSRAGLTQAELAKRRGVPESIEAAWEGLAEEATAQAPSSRVY